MPEDLIDPPNDEEPWGYDFEGDEIVIGDDVVEIDNEYIPLEKAMAYLISYGSAVNTEEYQNDRDF